MPSHGPYRALTDGGMVTGCIKYGELLDSACRAHLAETGALEQRVTEANVNHSTSDHGLDVVFVPG